MKNEKKNYTAPELTVVTIKVEQGFAVSGGLGLDYSFSPDPEQESQETWTNDNTYFGNSWY